jgi:hypothetical protein
VSEQTVQRGEGRSYRNCNHKSSQHKHGEWGKEEAHIYSEMVMTSTGRNGLVGTAVAVCREQYCIFLSLLSKTLALDLKHAFRLARSD